MGILLPFMVASILREIEGTRAERLCANGLTRGLFGPVPTENGIFQWRTQKAAVR